VTDSSFDFDLIVIGAGYGGFDAAKHAAGKGLKVAIVESSDMGVLVLTKVVFHQKLFWLQVEKLEK